MDTERVLDMMQTLNSIKKSGTAGSAIAFFESMAKTAGQIEVNGTEDEKDTSERILEDAYCFLRERLKGVAW